jgi:hypothetical protein
MFYHLFCLARLNYGHKKTRFAKSQNGLISLALAGFLMRPQAEFYLKSAQG